MLPYKIKFKFTYVLNVSYKIKLSYVSQQDKIKFVSYKIKLSYVTQQDKFKFVHNKINLSLLSYKIKLSLYLTR